MVGENFASFCKFGAYTTFLKVSLSDSVLVWALPNSHDLAHADKIS